MGIFQIASLQASSELQSCLSLLFFTVWSIRVMVALFISFYHWKQGVYLRTVYYVLGLGVVWFFYRQRQHISQLEQKVRESELQVHSAMLGCPAPYGDVYMLRMQVMRYNRVSVRHMCWIQWTYHFSWGVSRERRATQSKTVPCVRSQLPVISEIFCDSWDFKPWISTVCLGAVLAIQTPDSTDKRYFRYCTISNGVSDGWELGLRTQLWDSAAASCLFVTAY